MIKLKLLIFVLMLLGPCAWMACRGRQLGQSVAVTLCAQSLALIFLGYVLPFSAAAGVLAVVSAAAWLDALRRIRDLRKVCVSLLLPCALVFIAAVWLYDACAARQFISYDEFSHWGLIVKVIHAFDALPHMGQGAPYIQYTYPPSAAMLPSLACAILGYREGIAYFGYAVLLAGLLWGAAAKACRGRSVIACVLLYACLMAIFPLSILRLFVEPMAALLMVLLIMGGLDGQEPCLWEDALYAAMLAMCKNTGMVFVAAALFIRFFAARNRQEAKRAVCLLGVCLLCTASYQIYCSVHGIEAVISPSHFGENLSALLSGTLNEAYTSLPLRFLRFFFRSPLPQSGLYSSYGFGTCAVVMAVLLALCGVHIAIAQDRKAALRLWAGVWLANAAYIVMIVLSYFIGFSLEEVERLAESDRYTILVALWTGLLVSAMLIREAGRMRAGRRAALLCAMAALWLPLSHPEMTAHTFITGEYAEHMHWARITDRMDADYITAQLDGQTGARVLCMGDTPYVETRYLLCPTVDIGRFDVSWSSAPWSGSAESVREALKNGTYSHVYVGGLMLDNEDLAVDERYAVLTENGENLKERTLYRVVQDQDGNMVLMNMMANQES